VIPFDVLAATWPLLTVPQGQPRNPYKGLRPFTQRDAADFFGREAVVEKVVDLVNSLVTEQPASSSIRLLTILGPSGVGKSSLVMAGLLPKLQQGALPGSKDWVYLDPLVPGKHPLEALASTLKPQFPDTSFKTLLEDLEDDAARGLLLFTTQLAKKRETRVVLLIDQCEELFTQTESEDERQRFIRLLLNTCSEPRGSAVVLLTLRADFYDRPMQYPELFRLIETQHLSLLAIEPDNLRRVVEQPAALPDVQVTFEGELVNHLLSEVQGQVGALPLLQFTLDQLFQRRSGRQLTLSAYRELGGVKGALTKQAEETYAALPSNEHRKLARALFVRLIDPGASEQDTTRRRAALSEFSLPAASQTRLMRETIDAFITVRLLTTNEIAGTTTIEVSHEALIREWPRLAEWLREARDDIPLQQAISEDVAEWERRGQPRDRLYRGSQLKEARAWARRNTPSGNEVAFLRASAVHQTRSRVSVTALVLLFVLAAGLIVQLVQAQQSANPTRVTNLHDAGPGSLRQAINTAPDGSTITFDPSLRGGTILLTSGVLTISKNITLRGLGAGVLSISSGSHNSPIDVDSGVIVSIQDLAFTNSTITSPNNTSSESFINNAGKLTLTNCIVSGNTASGRTISIQGNDEGANGGGITNRGTLTLINSTIKDNIAFGGGGIYNQSGTLTLTNSTVAHNTAAGGRGGGIFIVGFEGANLILTTSTVSGNIAGSGTLDYEGGGQGGGIYGESMDSIITLTSSTVSDSTAAGHGSHSGGEGGGIFNRANKLVLNKSTVSGNTASGGSVGDADIANNYLASGGGGIFNTGDDAGDQYRYGTITLMNSTISNNTAASSGGGILDAGGQTNIIFCTFYGNAAASGGGIATGNGIDISHFASVPSKPVPSRVQIRTSIVADDHAPSSPDISGRLTSYGYNLFQANSGATFDPATSTQHSTDKILSVNDLTRVFADPVTLRDNKGTTKTLALAPDSPAVDQIPLAACHIKVTISLPVISEGSNPPTVTPTPIIITIITDQRGMKRPDGNEHFCDIGAYEYVDPPA
jgi:hypothetical protein